MLEWLTAGTAAGRFVVSILNLPRPQLELEIKSTGGSDGKVNFTLAAHNRGDRPALNCTMTVALGDLGVVSTVDGVRPFHVAAQELDHRERFSLARPTFGDLIPAFANETTLYGRRLLVQIRSGRRKWEASWGEIVYDRSTNEARYEVQQEVWRRGLVTEPPPIS